MNDLDGLIKETLVFTAQKGWTQSPGGFFAALVMFLGEKLDVEYALVDELLPDGKRARTLGLYASGQIIPDVEYDLRGTPCENVMGKTLCCYPRDIQALFPEDLLLQQMAAESYMGIPLWDSQGQPIGLIAVMGQRALEDRERAEALLQVVAIRCAHELERKRSEEERRRMEQELLRVQRLESIGRLASGVAHDMNNVLTAILGVSEVLRERLAPEAELRDSLDLVLQAALRGRSLVKGLTDFARDGLQDPRPLDLNGLLRQELALFQRTTLGKVELSADLEEPLPPVLGEASALGNLLMNLCVNALDAMPAGGRLALRSRALPDGGVEVSVEDSGEGMSPEVMARAMDPFFTTKPLGKGTGLGLSIVFGTMKAHGGSVELHSEPGRGTRVSLRFPALARPERPPEPAREGAPAEPGVPRTLRILLVDDEEMIRDTVAAMLGHGGHRVEAVPGGQPALDRLAAGLEVDLVILDQNMPGLSGLETLRALRRTHPALPVLLATGLLDPALEADLRGEARVWLLKKPFRLGELKAAVQGVFA